MFFTPFLIIGLQTLWIASIVATAIISSKKKQNLTLWIILSIFFGPLIFLIVLSLPSKASPVASDTVEDKPSSLRSLKRELTQLKESFALLDKKIFGFEKKLQALSKKKAPSLEVKPKPPSVEKKAVKAKPAKPKVSPVPKSEKSLELNLGRYWLSKIGSVILILGLAFLITYTFRFFNAFARIASGYLAATSLLWLGFRLDKKEGLKNYGRTILAAGWALLYFTTYAMYHFEASKILNSQLLNLILLAILVAALVVYSLRYKSQHFTALALFTGYFTATLSDVTYFTLASCALLALAMGFLICRLKMTKLLYYGIFLTYLTHFIWVSRSIDLSLIVTRNLSVGEVVFWLNSIFLLIYWIIFSVTIYYPKMHSQKAGSNYLPLASFCNFLFFFLLELGWVSRVYPSFKFYFAFCLGLVYLLFLSESYRLKNEKFIMTNYLIAISLLSLSLPLKFAPQHTNLFWLIEVPVILGLGLVLKKNYLKGFSIFLAILLYFKLIFLGYYSYASVNILDRQFLWEDILIFIGMISMFCCYYLYRSPRISAITKVKTVLKSANLFSFMAASYLVLFFWNILDAKWLTLALLLQALLLFFIGILISDKCFRLYALLILVMVWFRMLFVDQQFYYRMLKWPLIVIELGSSYLIYALSRIKKTAKLFLSYERGWLSLGFAATTFVLTVILFKEVNSRWISLALGLEGAVLFSSGFLFKDKKFRIAGFVVFLILLARVIFVDIVGLETIYRIVSFIAIGIIFLAISFVYTKYKESRLS